MLVPLHKVGLASHRCNGNFGEDWTERLRESAELPTEVKEVLAMFGRSEIA
jgi:NAD-dependent DNA ligase